MRLLICFLLAVTGWTQTGMMRVQRRAAGPPPTTVTYTANSNCAVNSASGTSDVCTWNASSSAPSAGNAVVLVVAFQTTGRTITDICDGTTRTTGCSDGSTWHSKPKYVNGSDFASQVWYTCNYAGVTGASQTLTIILDGSSTFYATGVYLSGNTTTSTDCVDGYNKNQSTTGTAQTSGAITTTNSHDYLLGLFSNWTSGSPTAGTDNQSNTMALLLSATGVAWVTGFAESATNTYTVSGTGPNGSWNAESVAIK